MFSIQWLFACLQLALLKTTTALLSLYNPQQENNLHADVQINSLRTDGDFSVTKGGDTEIAPKN
jgi:hypothetical protein